MFGKNAAGMDEDHMAHAAGTLDGRQQLRRLPNARDVHDRVRPADQTVQCLRIVKAARDLFHLQAGRIQRVGVGAGAHQAAQGAVKVIVDQLAEQKPAGVSGDAGNGQNHFFASFRVPVPPSTTS